MSVQQIFAWIIIVAEVLLTLLTMNNLFYSFSESTQTRISVWPYAVLCIVGVIYICYYCINIFKSKYVLTLVLFVIYLIFNSFIVASEEISKVISNCAWPVIAIIGFAVGFKNACFEKIQQIVRIVLLISIPILFFLIIKYSLSGIGSALISKDAFFIVVFIFPWTFLLKKSWFQILLMFIFFVLGMLSLKRTIILVMLPVLILWINYFLKDKGFSLFKRLVVFFVFIICGIMWVGDDVLVKMIIGRLSTISEDGGSGRDLIYSRIIDDIFNGDFLFFCFGGGISSVYSLVRIDAHMDILQVWHSLGFIGLMIYLAIYFRCVKLFVRYNRSSGKNRQLVQAVIFTFCIFIVMANLNCFIFNPSFITPIMFVLSFQLGILQYNLFQIDRKCIIC